MSQTRDIVRDAINGQVHMLTVELGELDKQIAALTEKRDAVAAELADAKRLEQHHANADGAS